MRLLALIFSLLSFRLIAQVKSFTPAGVGGGGAFYGLSFSPNNSQEFAVGTDMSEMFHTTSFGASFQIVPFTQLQVDGNLATSTWEFTSNPKIAYTISAVSDKDQRISVTGDGGKTWQRKSYDFSDDLIALKANPNRTNELLVNTYHSLYYSNDSGSSFTTLLNVPSGTGVYLAGVLWDGDTAYIGTDSFLLTLNGLSKHFTKQALNGIKSGDGLLSFSGAMQNGQTRFVGVTAPKTAIEGGIYKISDRCWGLATGVFIMNAARQRWQPVALDVSTHYFWNSAMAQNNTAVMYLGGMDDHKLPIVYRSADGGTTWQSCFLTTNNQNITTAWLGYGAQRDWSWAGAVQGLTVSPNNAKMVGFGSYMNIVVSTDGGLNWSAVQSNGTLTKAGKVTDDTQPFSNLGLDNTSAWQVYWPDPYHLYGGFTDIGLIQSTDGQNWSFPKGAPVPTVNNIYRIASTDAKHIYLACSSIHDIYEATHLTEAAVSAIDDHGYILYSADGGLSWKVWHNFQHPVYWIATDPSNPKRVYAAVASKGIWYSDELGSDSALSEQYLSLPGASTHPAALVALPNGNLLCTFSATVSTAANSFLKTSGLFLYDQKKGWQNVMPLPSAADTSMYYWCRDVVPDPAAPNTQWYVGTFGSYQTPPGAFKRSINGGLYLVTNNTWTKLTPDRITDVSSIAIDPDNQQRAYITTRYQGLWFTTNLHDLQGHPTWIPVTSYPFRQPQRVFYGPTHPREIWVTSFGYGLWHGKDQ